jgi:large subunit ribosomal protein L32
MAVPKKRTSQARRNQRRAHQAIGRLGLVACPNCGKLHMPHHVCPGCGYYKGRTVVATEATE